MVDAREGQFSEGLDGVGVEDHAAFAAQAPNLGHRLKGAGLVVGRHDGDECGVGAKGLGHGLGRDAAVVIDWQQCEGEPFVGFEVFQRMQHRVMLHGRGHQVAASLGPSEAGCS